MCDFVSPWRKGVISSMSVLESGFFRLHKDNNFFHGMQNIIINKTIMKKINKVRPKRPYLKMFIQIVASQKFELDVLSSTRLDRELVFDSCILLINSARTFVCSKAFES